MSVFIQKPRLKLKEKCYINAIWKLMQTLESGNDAQLGAILEIQYLRNKALINIYSIINGTIARYTTYYPRFHD